MAGEEKRKERLLERKFPWEICGKKFIWME